MQFHTLKGAYRLKLAMALVLIALGDAIFYQIGLFGGISGVFGLAMLAALLAARPALRHDRRAWIALLLAATYAGAMAWDPGPLPWTLFWITASIATLFPATAGFDNAWRWFQRLVWHGTLAAIGPLIDAVRLSRIRSRRGFQPTQLGEWLRVLALPAIGSALVLLLFAAANPVIEDLFRHIRLPAFNGETIARMVLLWPLLFTLAWALLRPRNAKRLLGTFDGSGDFDLPGASTTSIALSLIAFNLLFAAQNAMDAAWLWGLLPLPDGMTLAKYAHRGAYPLIATALFAGLFVLVFLRPDSSTAANPAIRGLVVAWIGQNLFLVASSILRTLEYVEAYSLTRLRIAALLWMGLVAVGLLLIVWRLLHNHSASWLINANALAAGCLLSVTSFVDLGTIAAQWNVRHAHEVDGSGSRLDLCYLRKLGSSSILPLIELEQRDLPGDLAKRVRKIREYNQRELYANLAGGNWSILGKMRLEQAQRLTGSVQRPRWDGVRRDCEGYRITEADRFVQPAAAPRPADSAAPALAPVSEPEPEDLQNQADADD